MIAGVDIGGTFTDLVLSADGQLTIHKLLSTPHDPSIAMLDGLTHISGGDLSRLLRVAHGSTVATNAILERKGAKVAFLATAGFKDLLFIGRQNRPDLYALVPTIPPPLVPRELCYDVPERLDRFGNVLTPLDLSAVDTIVVDLMAKNVDAVAVCLLYSFVKPDHERAVLQRIRECGFEGIVALSSDVLPEFREYERASATVLEAYVRPVMSRYVNHLVEKLPAPLRIMKSDGGVMNAARVRTQAIQTALSGPAAGVIGAFHIAQLAGFPDIITLDMGGTSTDVALIPGEPVRRPESEIDGLPLRIRLLDIETVGAGGGSIARVDAGGALRVGPESAGADPGPVIYGRGGQNVTVSDANAVLGRLDTDRFLGGGMKLDIGAAHTAVQALAAQIGMQPEQSAQGILDVANANIDRAVRRVSVARGYDPRDFTMVAFGGAGALHACAVADNLQIPRILIPRYPGVLCAFGLLVADVTMDDSRAIIAPVDEQITVQIAAYVGEMVQAAQSELGADGFAPERQVFRPALDMRYQGQAFELTLPYESGADAQTLIAAFHAMHEATYGHALPQRVVEVVNVRLQAVGVVDKPVIDPVPLTGKPLDGSRFERADLNAGDSFTGEALVFQLDSTIYIAAGWSVRVDAYHNLILERESSS